MGIFHSAYLAYGIQIPDMDEDTLDRGIPGMSEVGHLRAGAYDREMTFLVTECSEADLGQVATVNPDRATREQYERWDRDLRAAAKALGVNEPPEPCWLLIPAAS
ncbi:hypothetical protein ACGFZR_24635 [Streptomyces sp. NPDC048241]|uniref:hypothetical protein n=1 Tax=Streptomyces sp. NPDC048241 TaxID=3365521 RepID=UPI00371BA779